MILIQHHSGTFGICFLRSPSERADALPTPIVCAHVCSRLHRLGAWFQEMGKKVFHLLIFTSTPLPDVEMALKKKKQLLICNPVPEIKSPWVGGCPFRPLDLPLTLSVFLSRLHCLWGRIVEQAPGGEKAKSFGKTE